MRWSGMALFICASAWATPIFRIRVPAFSTPSLQPVSVLGPDAGFTLKAGNHLIFVTANLGFGTELTLHETAPQDTLWMQMSPPTLERDAGFAPVASFDVKADARDFSFVVEARSTSTERSAVVHDLRLIVVPLSSPGLWSENQLGHTVNSLGWATVEAVRVAAQGRYLTLASLSPASGVVGARVQTDDGWFPSGHSEGDRSWFVGAPVEAFFSAQLSMYPADAGIELQAIASPVADGGVTPVAANLERSRLWLISELELGTGSKFSYDPLASGTPVIVSVTPGDVYVTLQLAHWKSSGGQGLAIFTTEGEPMTAYTWVPGGARGHYPVASVDAITAVGPQLKLSSSLTGTVDRWGSFTGVLGPFPEGVVDLVDAGPPVISPDAGAMDAGRPDAGRLDAGLPLEGGTGGNVDIDLQVCGCSEAGPALALLALARLKFLMRATARSLKTSARASKHG